MKKLFIKGMAILNTLEGIIHIVIALIGFWGIIETETWDWRIWMPSLKGIRDIILNPDSYNILKYKHNYTPDGKYVLTGMFVPAFKSVLHLADSRGYCDEKKAREWYEKERLLKADDPAGLLIYKAEYCFTIEEALAQEGDNFFPREELAEQLAAIDIYKTTPKPERGYLVW